MKWIVHPWPSLAWLHCPLLSETLASETTVDGGHQAMDMRERPPPDKNPRQESNGINSSSIGGPSNDLWQIVGHLHIQFRDTWWTWAWCAKNLTERQFLILSTPSSVFGHGKYGNANHIPTIHGFLCINDLMLLLSYRAVIASMLFCFRIFIIHDQWETWGNEFIVIF